MRKFGLFLCLLTAGCALGRDRTVHLRINQLGYRADERKMAVAFSQVDQRHRRFELLDATSGRRVWGPSALGKNRGAYGNYAYHYHLDFSSLRRSGRYCLQIGSDRSLPFRVGDDLYAGTAEIILEYLRQQRCGYNPWLDQICHRGDSRTMYGPMPDSTFIDVSGGWHDAGDHLRYLMTSGNTVYRLLFSYLENGKFLDRFDYFGHEGPIAWRMCSMRPNGVGLDAENASPADQLFHQVADDRDHRYFELPFSDSTDYGWGKASTAWSIMRTPTTGPGPLSEHLHRHRQSGRSLCRSHGHGRGYLGSRSGRRRIRLSLPDRSAEVYAIRKKPARVPRERPAARPIVIMNAPGPTIWVGA